LTVSVRFGGCMGRGQKVLPDFCAVFNLGIGKNKIYMQGTKEASVTTSSFS